MTLQLLYNPWPIPSFNYWDNFNTKDSRVENEFRKKFIPPHQTVLANFSHTAYRQTSSKPFTSSWLKSISMGLLIHIDSLTHRVHFGYKVYSFSDFFLVWILDIVLSESLVFFPHQSFLILVSFLGFLPIWKYSFLWKHCLKQCHFAPQTLLCFFTTIDISDFLNT